MPGKRRRGGNANLVRLGRTDLLINRGIGVAILLLGAALIYSLAFSYFDLRVQYQWEVTENGERVPLVAITCPPPWSVVFDKAKPEGVVSGDICVMPSRGLLVEAGIVTILIPALAVWAFTRTKRPAPIEPLPLPIEQPERGRLH